MVEKSGTNILVLSQSHQYEFLPDLQYESRSLYLKTFLYLYNPIYRIILKNIVLKYYNNKNNQGTFKNKP